MSEIALPAFVALAMACAPGHDPNRLADFAQVESGRNTLLLNVNGPGGGSVHTATMDEAIATATRLIAAGKSVDLGIMQLNTQHLGKPGMPATVAEAMEPCRNIKAGAAVLADADRAAACIYNTGRPDCSNGYPEKIQAATARRVGSGMASVAVPGTAPASVTATPAQQTVDGWTVWVSPKRQKAVGDREASPAVTLTASKQEDPE